MSASVNATDESGDSATVPVDREAWPPLYRRPMKFSRLTERIGGEGARAWAVHSEAMRRRRAGQEVIVLSVGDPDFHTPRPIVEAAKASLDRGRTHYTDVIGDLPLRHAIARQQAARTG